jgi:hypothetical protein
MYNFILSHTVGGVTDTIQINNFPGTASEYKAAPVNWNKMQYTFTRNEKYDALFPTFTAQLGFVKGAKTWIDNIFDTYGRNAEINVIISAYNSDTYKFETFMTGIINMETVSVKYKQTDCDIIDNSFIHKILDRDSIPFDFKQDKCFDDLFINVAPASFVDLTVIGSNTTRTVKAVYPHKLFERAIACLTGTENGFYSELFGRIADGYSADGKYSRYMLTTGRLLRGYSETESTLNTTFESLFKSFNAIGNLGMAITGDITYTVNVDEKINFYDSNVILNKDSPRDLEFSFNQKYTMASVEVGYEKIMQNQNNIFGSGEYNQKSIYAVPLKATSNNFQILCPYRADGTAINICLDLGKTGTDENQNQFDNEIFIIVAKEIGGDLTSTNAVDFETVSGIYGSALQINMEISPVRMLYSWGNVLRSALEIDKTKYMVFQKNEGLSKLSTKKFSEAGTYTDCGDVQISNLDQPFLDNKIVGFNSQLTINEILSLKNNPVGLIKFWDYINEQDAYCWITEASTEPIDKKVNWQGCLISSYITPIEITFKFKLMDRGYIELLDGGKLLLLNQN